MLEEFEENPRTVIAVQFTGENLDEIIYELEAPVRLDVETEFAHNQLVRHSQFQRKGRKMILSLADVVG